jgi:hypothetical protein
LTENFRVTVTSHDLLKEGVTEAASMLVAVAGRSYADRQTTAAQFVYALLVLYRSRYDMVVSATPVYEELELTDIG